MRVTDRRSDYLKYLYIKNLSLNTFDIFYIINISYISKYSCIYYIKTNLIVYFSGKQNYTIKYGVEARTPTAPILNYWCLSIQLIIAFTILHFSKL